ncbi:universal stress protein [Gilvimarinus sp. F26214L]|uniref:universal stress protein n=1 Tax=Gilvimarinus sp. DZF01 TaxID=3461371 RepID=UPI0040465F3E
MSIVTSILVPLDGSAHAAKSLGSAVWLADKLDAKLHLLRAGTEALPSRQALMDLKIPRQHWSHITLHQSASYPEQAILQAVQELRVDLIVMSAQGQSANGREDNVTPLGHVTRTVIIDCEVPVLLLPPAFHEKLPWRSLLVPISGEVEADQVLTLAIRLAQPLGLAVHVAHVVDGGDYGYLAETEYADSPYHEYAGRLEAMVNRASMQCSPAECRCLVEDVALCRGDIAEELVKIIRKRDIDVLAIGWHGHLAPGRARILTQLLQRCAKPVLLLKSEQPPEFALKVGEALE